VQWLSLAALHYYDYFNITDYGTILMRFSTPIGQQHSSTSINSVVLFNVSVFQYLDAGLSQKHDVAKTEI
jgi:hypothetical protein